MRVGGNRFYDKRDDFNFLIVNIPCICSNIPAALAYGVCISPLIFQTLWFLRWSWYPKWYRVAAKLPTKKLSNQWFIVVRLKSSLRKVYCRHHSLVNCYGIPVVTNDQWYVPFVVITVPTFPHSLVNCHWIYFTRLIRWVPLMEQELISFPFRNTRLPPPPPQALSETLTNCTYNYQWHFNI